MFNKALSNKIKQSAAEPCRAIANDQNLEQTSELNLNQIQQKAKSE
jgi:hypothetical protein